MQMKFWVEEERYRIHIFLAGIQFRSLKEYKLPIDVFSFILFSALNNLFALTCVIKIKNIVSFWLLAGFVNLS